ncbi:CoA transferase [Erythrobacteraceae bacterium CFH 75059]|uniref:CaiB/BaiF CoA transferase family protein n=1 Tax=Qipengyuania thermophila TaxID=2509361 RepID=UPI0010213684|nr:CaiB/BaiF CoA-transferase family protein [Qipengyuania thermophila]TCD02076.1 CoA transferase [Erythrobacteraceae bacterium CFH 75059]
MGEAKGPLAGVRVLEFAGIGPGPHCAMLLADMGAEVVRIERPGTAVFNPVVERGRHRLALDIRTDEGRAAARAAAGAADVLLEGFRPGVMERNGLGPDELCAANPRLVYARMTGWGQDGPLARTAGHDITYIAVAGALACMSAPDGNPVPPQNLVGDFGGGSLYCALGIVAALLERERSGRGQVVDAAIVDGVASLMSFFTGAPANPLLDPAGGRGMLGGAAHFYRTYRCADGRHIAVGAIEPQFYAELLDRLGVADALGEGQLDPGRWDAAGERLAALFATRTRDEWCALFEGSDACVAPVLEPAEAADHPHNAARGVFLRHGDRMHTAPAPRFARTPGAIRDSAEDGAQVVARWTGGAH